MLDLDLVDSPNLIQESKVKSLRGLAGYLLSQRSTTLCIYLAELSQDLDVITQKRVPGWDKAR